MGEGLLAIDFGIGIGIGIGTDLGHVIFLGPFGGGCMCVIGIDQPHPK